MRVEFRRVLIRSLVRKRGGERIGFITSQWTKTSKLEDIDIPPNNLQAFSLHVDRKSVV